MTEYTWKHALDASALLSKTFPDRCRRDVLHHSCPRLEQTSDGWNHPAEVIPALNQQAGAPDVQSRHLAEEEKPGTNIRWAAGLTDDPVGRIAAEVEGFYGGSGQHATLRLPS